MIRYFLVLAVTGASLMGADFVSGPLAASEVRGPGEVWHGVHFLLSLLTVLTLLAIHSMVYIYLMTTNKWTEDVVRAYQLSEGYNTQAKKNKQRAVRFVAGSMSVIAVTAWLGAAADTRDGSYAFWHLGVAAAALTYNLGSFFVEYVVIVAQARLLLRLKNEVEGLRAERHGADLINEESAPAYDKTALEISHP